MASFNPVSQRQGKPRYARRPIAAAFEPGHAAQRGVCSSGAAPSAIRTSFFKTRRIPRILGRTALWYLSIGRTLESIDRVATSEIANARDSGFT
jgi:hypothetical protein